MRHPLECKCLSTSSDPYGCLSSFIRLHGLTIPGDVDISWCTAIRCLPTGLAIAGDLDVSCADNLISLGQDLTVGGDLEARNCSKLETLAPNSSIAGNLDISRCKNVVRLSPRLKIGGSLYASSCSHLTCLPSDLTVAGGMDFFRCESLLTLLPQMQVSGHLTLSYCENLIRLPPGLTVAGNLNIRSAHRLVELPDDLRVAGNLELCFLNLTTLPKGLCVDGNLYVASCRKIVSLPEDMKIGGALRIETIHDLTCDNLRQDLPCNVSSCHVMRLKRLPDNLTVMGDLELTDVPIESLPRALRVTGDLRLDNCPVIDLPSDMQVGGSVTLKDCRRITELPHGLAVLGDLKLRTCHSLRRLPSALRVDGDLSLSSCDNLSSLPDKLCLGRDLKVRDCLNLTSLPSDIMDLGPTSSEGDRVIFITRTGISETVRARVAAHAPVGMLFLIDDLEPPSQHYTFPTLSSALAAWTSSNEMDAERTEALLLDQCNVEQQQSLRLFLSRLRDTAECRNPQTRPSLVNRVANLLQEMHHSAELAEMCSERLSHALESCDDRIMLLMNQLEVAVKVHKATSSLSCAQELKALGVGLLKLEVVHKHAAATCRRLAFVDEIEVYLKYETKLCDALDLPVSTRKMLYGADVTPEELELARQDALLVAADARKRNTFFTAWWPWLQHKRSQLANVYSYDKLCAIKCRTYQGLTCPISQEPLHRLRQPVALGTAEHPRVYESALFLAWWCKCGREPAPAPQTPVNLSDLRRVVGSKRRDSACYVTQGSDGIFNSDSGSDPASDTSLTF